MSAHQPQDLKQMQSLPLEAKIRMSQRRIRDWYDYWDGQVYVSFSGGKDSTVLKHLVESTPGVYDVPSLFVNTGLEYPEIQKFAMSQPNVTTVRPAMRFDEVIRKYGYPAISKDVSNCIYWARRGSPSRLARVRGTLTKKDGLPSMFNCKKWEFMMDAPFDIGSDCCKVMKKQPSAKYERETGRKPILGLLAEESIKRRDAWMKTGCNAFDKKRPQSQPMAFWTEQDVLHYIKKFNIPYCSVYGDIVSQDEDGNLYDMTPEYIDVLCASGNPPKLITTDRDRTGCIFCMFGCHMEGEPNRFQKLKETHPRQYEYCIGGGEMVDGKWQPNKEGLGLGRVLDYIGVKYD